MSDIKQVDAESIDKTFSDSIGVFTLLSDMYDRLSNDLTP